MIGVIDYGVGNLFSLTASLKHLGLKTVVTDDADTLLACDKLILPGVGAFGDARRKLSEKGLDRLIVEEASRGKPLLGICLGMQMLFDSSSEYGFHKGLGLIGGRVEPIEPDLTKPLKIPHIGWNALHFVKDSPLFSYVDEGEFVYFVHSYYAKDCAPDTLCTAEYDIPLTAAVGRGNVFGTQFHPEKSGDTGLRILKGFADQEVR